MTELIVGEKYKLYDNEILIIAQSPVTGNYIGEYVSTGRLVKFLSDGHLINNIGSIVFCSRLIKIPKVVEVEYEFWVNFYEDGTAGQTYKSYDDARKFIDRTCIETKKFTHKATYTE